MTSSSTLPQTILFLATNPKDTSRLRLDQELRDISEGLQRAQKRDQFNLEQRWAVRPRDIQRAMLDVKPQIIHFSGHGSGEEGLVFEDDTGNIKLVDSDALAGLFELFAGQIDCVLLNGCYSEVQAQAIVQHIPHVVAMNSSIGDDAAIAFAVGFYDALGAGRDVEFAYKLGCAAIRMEGIAEHLTPVLLTRPTTVDTAVSSQPAPQHPDHSASKPTNSTAAERFQKRGALFQSLSNLPGPQFEQLVFSLDVPRSNLGSTAAAQGDRVSNLLTWAESSVGCGLETLEQVLNAIINPR